MVTLKPDTTATFFFVTDSRATDRTTADSPLTFSIDSSGAWHWWYQPVALRPARPAAR